MAARFFGKAPVRAVLFLSLSMIASCATVDYLPPQQGTSADLQIIVAQSLEDNLKEVLFDPAGKTVDIQVRVLGGQQTPIGLERYAKSLFEEWTVRKGGAVGPGGWRMDVFLPVLGTTATRRDLSFQYVPLYYSERFRGSGQMVVVVRDGEGKIAGAWRTGKGSDAADVFLMKMLGPIAVPF